MEKLDLPRRGERKVPPLPMVAPWLVFPHGKDGKFHTFYNVCDDADVQLKKRYSNKFIPELSRKCFWQKNCHQGWLIVISNNTTDPNFGDCFLWNPQTLDAVQLHSILHYYETDKYCLQGCILTSPPHLNTTISNSSSSSNNSSDGDNYDKDYMVYLLFDGGHNNVDFTYVLLFCHPGEKEWRRHELIVSEEPQRMLYLKNKLLVMCSKYVYFRIDVQDGSDIDDDETLAVGARRSICPWNIMTHRKPGPAGGGLVRTLEEYFVESFGEVFKIEIWSIPRGSMIKEKPQTVFQE
ncbi:uncharacterized protein LOC113301938 isoform X2 [Papaver somniferum]|uniref:uncharacterized protein LOC113301938 isoform X2 n=1 Tax=Papaver somniferum TaxID=3469 RepID=UPI000E703926|nr:uncharacterized protein LOC113301938 isoform X2 [Papaver somniferum]